MALSSTLMALAPTALRLGSELSGIGKSSPTRYEKELFRMADVFGSEASVPITETRAFRSGMTMMDEWDRRNRSAIDSHTARTGATDEAKVAMQQQANVDLNRGLQHLLTHAKRNKDQNRVRYLNTLGAAHGARQGRIARDNQAMNQILSPLSDATSAFMMADLFGPDSIVDSTPEAKKVKAPDAVYIGNKGRKKWGRPYGFYG